MYALALALRSSADGVADGLPLAAGLSMAPATAQAGCWRMVRNLIVLALAVHLGLSLLLFLRQDRYLYFPSTTLATTPAAANLPFEDVHLTTDDGETLHAWLIPAAAGQERGCILFCHGNGGNISHRLDTLRIFHDLGYTTLIFDYRGYGLSSGRPSEQGTYRDAVAAWNFLRSRCGDADRPPVIFGRSLGGAVAAWLAGEVNPTGLIVESTFTSIPDMARELYPYLPVRLFCRFSYATRDYVARANCPVAVFHSPDDSMIGIAHGRAIHAAATTPKRFVELRGDHNSTVPASGQAYIDALAETLAWMQAINSPMRMPD